MTKWNRILAIIMVVLMLLNVSSCISSDGADDNENTRSFIDSTGRAINIPEKIERIAVSGPLAQMVVFAIAPDMLVGIASEWDKAAEAFLSTEHYNLSILGQLYGGKGEMNLEELLKADPDIVIDIGEPKESIKDDMDALTKQTGIPFVHISATLSTLDEAYVMLGNLLSMEDAALSLATYCRETYDKVVAIANSVEKKNVLYVLGDQGQNVIAKDSYHSEVLDLLCNNIAVVENPSSKGTGNEVSMEQIMVWNPDYIVFAPESIYSTVNSDDRWDTINAVATNNYYEVPLGPYNWMGFPPSVQRLLGMLWLAKVLYPQAADYDMYAEAETYFELFYHCDLTLEQYNALVANSLGR